MTNDKLIQVKDLKKYYKGDRIKALDGVTVDINQMMDKASEVAENIKNDVTKDKED